MNQTLKMFHDTRKLYNRLSITVMERYDLTRCELDILLFLYNNPDLDTAKDIVDKRGLVKSHVSMGIDHLVQKKYIEVIQDQNDKRRYHLRLLDKSHEVIQEGLNVQSEFQKRLFKNFSEEDKVAFEKMMKMIYENIKEEIL